MRLLMRYVLKAIDGSWVCFVVFLLGVVYLGLVLVG